MKLWIKTESLKGNESGFLKQGALYGLVRLTDLSYEIGFDPRKLTTGEQRLLNHEQFEPAFTSPGEADGKVALENDDRLVLKNNNGEVVTSASGWKELCEKILFPRRAASLKRKTGETDIEIAVNLDGSGKAEIETGLNFFDHMLDQIARHGLIDLSLKCKGDLNVDEHHTIEDVAISMGEVFSKAVSSEKMGIQRYSFVLPMDESRSMVALDLSGRPYLEFSGSFSREYVGDFPTEMTEHFFYSLAMNLKATLHIEIQGKNDHHKVEACFKGFARCFRAAISRNERTLNLLPSTKGLL